MAPATNKLEAIFPITGPIRRRLPLCPKLASSVTPKLNHFLQPSKLMEGLIPFIYKAIKERKTRSYSRCSSARGFDGMEDGDVWEQKQWKEDGVGTHRRHRSLEELAGEVGGAVPEWPAGGMRRGKSSRIFSCIGGM